VEQQITGADAQELERLNNLNKVHKDQYAKDQIKKEWQDEKQVAADKWKFFKHTEYKNGIIKHKCVGVAKAFSGENGRRLISNRGVDMVKFGFVKKGKMKEIKDGRGN